MQIRINHKKSDRYSPLHETKPLTDITSDEAQFSEDEHENEYGWKSSRRIVAGLFILVLALFGAIVFFADEFRDTERLVAIRVEGNRALRTSEVFALAKIDRSQKFYDIDLRTIAARIEQHPVVRQTLIEREVNPNTLVIKVIEREPRAMVIAEGDEPAIVDAEYTLFWPRRLSGLIDPDKLLTAPMLSGVSYKDSVTLRTMIDLLTTLQTAEDGAMKDVIAELKRTTSGAYIAYVGENLIPIYLGAPKDAAFHTVLETEQKLSNEPADRSLFQRQVALLAAMWKKQLSQELAKLAPQYVDARYDGQIIVKTKS